MKDLGVETQGLDIAPTLVVRGNCPKIFIHSMTMPLQKNIAQFFSVTEEYFTWYLCRAFRELKI